MLAGIISAESASAFSYRPVPAGTVNLSSSVERDVYTMADWAASYGVQQADGLQLTSYDGKDYFPMTQAEIPAGSPVMYIPSDLVFSSSKAAQEFGSNLSASEDALNQAGLQDKVPLLRVFFKVLAEYEKGDSSPFFPWLNSLPRVFNTGASMTYACFDWYVSHRIVGSSLITNSCSTSYFVIVLPSLNPSNSSAFSQACRPTPRTLR
jgi:hypothetical protein